MHVVYIANLFLSIVRFPTHTATVRLGSQQFDYNGEPYLADAPQPVFPVLRSGATYQTPGSAVPIERDDVFYLPLGFAAAPPLEDVQVLPAFRHVFNQTVILSTAPDDFCLIADTSPGPVDADTLTLFPRQCYNALPEAFRAQMQEMGAAGHVLNYTRRQSRRIL